MHAFYLAIILLFIPALSIFSDTVDIYLATGQSNAKSQWSTSIEKKLNSLYNLNETRIVKRGQNGAHIYNWWSDKAEWLFYADLNAVQNEILNITNEGKIPRFRGIFWFQGESDTMSRTNMDMYKYRFRNLINAFKDAIGIEDPIIVLNAVDTNQDPYYDDPVNVYGRTRDDMEYMRNILFELGEEFNGFTMDTREYARYDNWHIELNELSNLGEETADRLFREKYLVHLYLATGQSNAKLDWASEIKSKMNSLSDIQVDIVHNMHPGDSIYNWWSDGAMQNYLDDIELLNEKITNLKQVGKLPAFNGLIWFQGESDTSKNSNNSRYKDTLKSIINDLKIRYTNQNPYVLLNIIDANPDYSYDIVLSDSNRSRDSIDEFRDIMVTLSDEINCEYIDTRGFDRYDLYHLTQSSRVALAKKTAEKTYLDNYLQSYPIKIEDFRDEVNSLDIRNSIISAADFDLISTLDDYISLKTLVFGAFNHNYIINDNTLSISMYAEDFGNFTSVLRIQGIKPMDQFQLTGKFKFKNKGTFNNAYVKVEVPSSDGNQFDVYRYNPSKNEETIYLNIVLDKNNSSWRDFIDIEIVGYRNAGLIELEIEDLVLTRLPSQRTFYFSAPENIESWKLFYSDDLEKDFIEHNDYNLFDLSNGKYVIESNNYNYKSNVFYKICSP